ASTGGSWMTKTRRFNLPLCLELLLRSRELPRDLFHVRRQHNRGHDVEKLLEDMRPSLDAQQVRLNADLFLPTNFIQTARLSDSPVPGKLRYKCLKLGEGIRMERPYYRPDLETLLVTA